MLVGRSAETATLDQLLVDARAGRSGVLVLRGEAGIGKSALLDFAAERADGMTVLRSVGIETESEFAFAGLHQLFRPVLDRVEELPAPQAAAVRSAFALSSEPVEDRFHVALGVLGLLSEVADERPLLCLVDDAQWLDPPSMEALLFAARRVEVEAVAIVFAARDDPTRPFAAPGIPDLRPSPLSNAEARELAAARLTPGTSPGTIERLVETAHGNPLALLELATSGELGGDVVPTTSLEETYLARIRRLPAAVQSLLLLAAAEDTGDRGTIARAAAEVGLDETPLAEAEAAGLVRVTAQHVDFHHPLVRSATYRGAGFAERERAHRTLAAVLTSESDADRRAWHRAAATVGTDDEVAAELEASASRARLRGGHGSAASALVRAAELTSSEVERGRRLLFAATAAGLAGDAARTIAFADRAYPLISDPLWRADLAAVHGNAELQAGRGADASDRFAAAAEAAAPHDSLRALELLVASQEAAGIVGDQERLRRAHRLSRVIPFDPTDQQQAMLATLLEASERIYDEGRAEAAPLLRQALSLFSGSPDPRHHLWAGVVASFLGQQAVAHSLYGGAVAAARASGALGYLPRVLGLRADASLRSGNVAEAAAEAEEAVRLARDLGIEPAGAYPLAVLAWIAGLQGRDGECRELAARVVALAEPRSLAVAVALARWAIAELELGTGRWDDALAHLLELREVRIGFGHPLLTNLSVPSFVEAAVRAGRPEAAHGPLAAFAAWTDVTGAPHALAQLARSRALLAESSEEAIEQFEGALELHAIAGSVFEQARTQLHYGELLRRLRRRSDAREHLRAALQTFERLNATAWSERTAVELRATGESARKRDPSTLGQLTPQELQIARLVGDGASNKEVAAQLFLSPRTVEYHLRKVFQKLGIASRAELIKQGVGEELAAVAQ